MILKIAESRNHPREKVEERLVTSSNCRLSYKNLVSGILVISFEMLAATRLRMSVVIKYENENLTECVLFFTKCCVMGNETC